MNSLEKETKSQSQVDKLVQIAREAQTKFREFSQSEVDNLFTIAANAAANARIPLAQLAVAETGMGVVEDKVIKNHFASEFIHFKYKDMKTCGVIGEDAGFGYKKIAEPMGIIGAVIPVTNPTSTAIFKLLIALKTRNAMIISPHPRAIKATSAAAKVINDAIVAAGAPSGLIQILEAKSIEETQELMQKVSLILATGGGGLVKAAYSSGTPAYGVGAGNAPAYIHKSADIMLAVTSVIQSNTFDNGVVCATENHVIVDAEIYDKVVAEFKRQHAAVIGDKKSCDSIRKIMFREGNYGLLNPALIGQKATKIAEMAGISVPSDTKMMLFEIESTEYDEPLAHEKLAPYTSLFKAKDTAHACQIAKGILRWGPGHTASMFADLPANKDVEVMYTHACNAGRIIVNTPSALGAIGDVYNFFLEPSLTLGCGTWGKNVTSECIGPKHLLNIKMVAERRNNML